MPAGGRKAGTASHTECPDSAAQVSSERSSGESSPRKAGSRACSRCGVEDEKRGAQGEGGGLGPWARCAGPTEKQGFLVARRAGAAAGTPECSPLEWGLQSSSSPLTRDSEAMPSPLVLEPFAHTSLLLMPWMRPSEGEAHYLCNAPGAAQGKPGGFPSFPFASTLGML